MRYFMMVMGDADYEADKPPSDELQRLMGEYIGASAQAGTFIDGAGLMPTRHGFKAQSRDGQISFTDGPFAESREIVGGYAIVEAADDAAARQIARDFIDVHARGGVMNVDCQIRPIAE